MEKESFGKRLKELRLKKNLTRKKLASLLGLSDRTVGYYESGERQSNYEILRKMASILNTTTDHLLGRTEDRTLDSQMKNTTGIIPAGRNVKIPILGIIRAGEPIYTDEHIIGYDDVPITEVKGGEYFFLIVKGDSMTGARIYPGDKVLVQKQNLVENNQIAVVLINDEEATLKRIKFLDKKVILYPDNPSHTPQVYDYRDVQIIGRVISVKFDVS
ncbi:helix-turn-helix domain-containing protein [candidate division NPL-UPA2 bacterium]|nr:helix-turn-helix domain-containing protein [candidate division NPL-UPA2 bacterium]